MAQGPLISLDTISVKGEIGTLFRLKCAPIYQKVIIKTDGYMWDSACYDRNLVLLATAEKNDQGVRLTLNRFIVKPVD